MIQFVRSGCAVCFNPPEAIEAEDQSIESLLAGRVTFMPCCAHLIHPYCLREALATTNRRFCTCEVSERFETNEAKAKFITYCYLSVHSDERNEIIQRIFNLNISLDHFLSLSEEAQCREISRLLYNDPARLDIDIFRNILARRDNPLIPLSPSKPLSPRALLSKLYEIALFAKPIPGEDIQQTKARFEIFFQ